MYGVRLEPGQHLQVVRIEVASSGWPRKAFRLDRPELPEVVDHRNNQARLALAGALDLDRCVPEWPNTWNTACPTLR